jgi:hypothetical protein
MKREFYLTKSKVITFGTEKDLDQVGNINLTPCLTYGKMGEKQKKYIEKGFSLAICWLGYYIGFSLCKMLNY